MSDRSSLVLIIVAIWAVCALARALNIYNKAQFVTITVVSLLAILFIVQLPSVGR